MSKGEAGPLEFLLNDAIQPACHLLRQVVLPVSYLATPKPQRVLEGISNGGTDLTRHPMRVHRQVLQVLEAAQPHHFLHDSAALLFLGERNAQELGAIISSYLRKRTLLLLGFLLLSFQYSR